MGAQSSELVDFVDWSCAIRPMTDDEKGPSRERKVVVLRVERRGSRISRLTMQQHQQIHKNSEFAAKPSGQEFTALATHCSIFTRTCTEEFSRRCYNALGFRSLSALRVHQSHSTRTPLIREAGSHVWECFTVEDPVSEIEFWSRWVGWNNNVYLGR